MPTILVSDDDLTTLTVIERSLSRQGYSVIRSSNGLRTWQILEDNPHIDLVISDVIMPDLDGRDFVAKVRRDHRFANLPVVMISGIVSLREINDLLLHGASRFIPKPVPHSELMHTLEVLLGNVQDSVGNGVHSAQ